VIFNKLAAAINRDNNLQADLRNYLNALIKSKNNSSYRFILSKGKILGHLIFFIKRIIRKLLSWYIEPICQRQTVFNNAVTQLSEALIYKNTELENIQKEANEVIFKLQNKMDKFNALELDTSPGKSQYYWDNGTIAQSGEDMILAFIYQSLNIPLDEISYLDLGSNHTKKITQGEKHDQNRVYY
jgi:hypothetical protein